MKSIKPRLSYKNQDSCSFFYEKKEEQSQNQIRNFLGTEIMPLSGKKPTNCYFLSDRKGNETETEIYFKRSSKVLLFQR